MADAYASDLLLDAIAGATGRQDFPARIGLTAAALRRIARSRFRANAGLRVVCGKLQEPDGMFDVDGTDEAFTDADAQVVAFFLQGNAKRRALL